VIFGAECAARAALAVFFTRVPIVLYVYTYNSQPNAIRSSTGGFLDGSPGEEDDVSVIVGAECAPRVNPRYQSSDAASNMFYLFSH